MIFHWPQVPHPRLFIDHLNHQALMRSYQGRFVLLPTSDFSGSIVAMRQHYAPAAMAAVDAERDELEQTLIEPHIAALAVNHQTAADFIKTMLTRIQTNESNPFLSWLDTCPDRTHHYRNFLIQSGTDLLAEASRIRTAVIGEYGPPAVGAVSHPNRRVRLRRA